MAKKLRIIKDFRIVLAISTIAFTGLLVSFGTSMAQLYDVRLDGSSFLMTNVSLSNALVAGTIGKDEFIDHQALKVFYQSRHDQPYWVGTLGPKSHAKELLGVLENAWTHGLNPAHYHVEEIRALIEKPGFTPQLELELTLTDAFIRYARDLSGIRVDPSSLKVDGESWRQPKSLPKKNGAPSTLSTTMSMDEGMQPAKSSTRLPSSIKTHSLVSPARWRPTPPSMAPTAPMSMPTPFRPISKAGASRACHWAIAMISRSPNNIC